MGQGTVVRTSILFRYDVPINSTWQGLLFVRCLDIDSSLHRQDGRLPVLYMYIIQVSPYAASLPRADIFKQRGFVLCNCHLGKANFLLAWQNCSSRTFTPRAILFPCVAVWPEIVAFIPFRCVAWNLRDSGCSEAIRYPTSFHSRYSLGARPNGRTNGRTNERTNVKRRKSLSYVTMWQGNETISSVRMIL